MKKMHKKNTACWRQAVGLFPSQITKLEKMDRKIGL